MAKTPPPPICMLRGHEGVVTALHFTNETDDCITVKPSLISGSDIGEIYIWNLKAHRTYHQFKCHDGKMIMYISYYKSSLLSQGRDREINIWRFSNNQWIIKGVFKSADYGFCTSELFLTESRAYLVVPTGDGSSITFYDYETENVLCSYVHKKTSAALNNVESSETCMCIKMFQTATKLFLLLGYESGYICLWDYESQTEKSRLKCHSEVLVCLDFDAKFRNQGISGSVDNVLQVWKIEDNQLVTVRQITITNPGISSVKIRNDGKIAITAGQDYAIRVFSWKNMKPLAVLQFHTMPVVSLQFYMESFGNYNSIFASGSKDKNIGIWSIY